MSTTATTTVTAPQTSECITNITEDADFATISYAKLRNADADELVALRKACEQDGFWYLDLRDENEVSGVVVQDVHEVYKIAGDFFALDDDEKMAYDIDLINAWKLNGYTPFGRNAGLRGDNKKFGVEAYSLPRDNMCNPIPGEAQCLLPPAFQENSAFLTEFMNQLHNIGLDMLKSLDYNTRGRSSDWRENGLASVHRPFKPSTTCMTIGRYPYLSSESSNAGLAAHTDVGSLTILFCGDRGLQAFRPTTGRWQYLEAKPGCAVINIGDSLRFLSGKTFSSALHRVIPYPGTVIENRFSCAYFIRPELDAGFVDENGKRWKSIDWHTKKYKGYRQAGKMD
ncbi:hypothetical protein AYL99_01781 [Fonsecaea erecta]|uniref:Fe2OG dioxygenase domain-containing protein n=1 Tax=Fonsecaea erecta TaxID=1367422 RepID=A0A178ZRV2_9EURO|nr:hypothetical protein AYL99_01781 [Fonsecaea erecta]OAP62554.1 hypothetical protein AYL99_01781 [Fonsecaea erecta]